MPRVSHLIRRNGTYWFKIDLPDHLSGLPVPPAFPESLSQLVSPCRCGHLKTEVWLSLRTAAEPEARRRVGLESARYGTLFEQASAFVVDGRHGREFRNTIARIPKGLPQALQRLPVTELLTRNLIGYELRSATTINKALTLLGAVLGRAEQDGHFDGEGWRNPFDVAFDVDAADEDYYEPFSLNELRRLMASPVFADGQRPRRGRADTAKWGPLVALYQGARRTEVIQLLTSDIAKDSDTGVWTIRFDREDDKRIKTVSSIRRIPVHPQLIAFGFLDFVESRRDIAGQHASLWPGFEDRKKLASRANRWSEWFNCYLAEHVVDDPVKKFHSFRATFKRFGRAAGVDEVVINHLVGHSNNSVGARYGRKRDADGVRDTGYRCVLLAMKADPSRLSFRYEEMLRRARDICDGDSPVGSSVSESLVQMAKLAKTIQPAPVIEWDEDVLDIVEPYFLFFLRWAPTLSALAKDTS